jgi:hypothetical protein
MGKLTMGVCEPSVIDVAAADHDADALNTCQFVPSVTSRKSAEPDDAGKLVPAIASDVIADVPVAVVSVVWP